jgi:hypothetical protein
MRSLIPLLLAVACGEPDKPEDTGPPADSETPEDSAPLPVDADGDGIPVGEDCDDTDADSYPGAEELCDGRDNDCDGEADEGLETTAFPDRDGDGYGDDAEALSFPCDEDPTLALESTRVTADLVLDAMDPMGDSLESWPIDGVVATWDQLLDGDELTATVTAWDTLGVGHTVWLALERRETTLWGWSLLTDGAELDLGTAGCPFGLSYGTLSFDDHGVLVGITSVADPGPVAWSSGATIASVVLQAGLDGDGEPIDGSAAVSGEASQVTRIQADGYPTTSGQGGDCDDSDPAVFPGQGC